ncbi:hypothetical protein PFISCL1PPCAC_13053, partial [Pristionchus fissidentatus]
YGFDYDESFALEIVVSVQVVLPIMNTFLLHPLVVVMLIRLKTMKRDIRLGYYSIMTFLLLYDWIMFGTRAHILSPYAAFYCDGPLCGLSQGANMAICSLTVALNLPCFVFLVVRMHQTVLQGTGSRWILSKR